MIFLKPVDKMVSFRRFTIWHIPVPAHINNGDIYLEYNYEENEVYVCYEQTKIQSKTSDALKITLKDRYCYDLFFLDCNQKCNGRAHKKYRPDENKSRCLAAVITFKHVPLQPIIRRYHRVRGSNLNNTITYYLNKYASIQIYGCDLNTGIPFPPAVCTRAYKAIFDSDSESIFDVTLICFQKDCY
jgi:hypothetical protein